MYNYIVCFIHFLMQIRLLRRDYWIGLPGRCYVQNYNQRGWITECEYNHFINRDKIVYEQALCVQPNTFLYSMSFLPNIKRTSISRTHVSIYTYSRISYLYSQIRCHGRFSEYFRGNNCSNLADVGFSLPTQRPLCLT